MWIYHQPFTIEAGMITGGPFASSCDTPGCIWVTTCVSDDFDFAAYKKQARAEFESDPGVKADLDEWERWEHNMECVEAYQLQLARAKKSRDRKQLEQAWDIYESLTREQREVINDRRNQKRI